MTILLIKDVVGGLILHSSYYLHRSHFSQKNSPVFLASLFVYFRTHHNEVLGVNLDIQRFLTWSSDALSRCPLRFGFQDKPYLLEVDEYS